MDPFLPARGREALGKWLGGQWRRILVGLCAGVAGARGRRGRARDAALPLEEVHAAVRRRLRLGQEAVGMVLHQGRAFSAFVSTVSTLGPRGALGTGRQDAALSERPRGGCQGDGAAGRAFRQARRSSARRPRAMPWAAISPTSDSEMQ